MSTASAKACLKAGHVRGVGDAVIVHVCAWHSAQDPRCAPGRAAIGRPAEHDPAALFARSVEHRVGHVHAAPGKRLEGHARSVPPIEHVVAPARGCRPPSRVCRPFARFRPPVRRRRGPAGRGSPRCDRFGPPPGGPRLASTRAATATTVGAAPSRWTIDAPKYAIGSPAVPSWLLLSMKRATKMALPPPSSRANDEAAVIEHPVRAGTNDRICARGVSLERRRDPGWRYILRIAGQQARAPGEAGVLGRVPTSQASPVTFSPMLGNGISTVR